LQIAGAITGTVGRQCPSAWKARATKKSYCTEAVAGRRRDSSDSRVSEAVPVTGAY